MCLRTDDDDGAHSRCVRCIRYLLSQSQCSRERCRFVRGQPAAAGRVKLSCTVLTLTRNARTQIRWSVILRAAHTRKRRFMNEQRPRLRFCRRTARTLMSSDVCRCACLVYNNRSHRHTHTHTCLAPIIAGRFVVWRVLVFVIDKHTRVARGHTQNANRNIMRTISVCV